MNVNTCVKRQYAIFCDDEQPSKKVSTEHHHPKWKHYGKNEGKRFYNPVIEKTLTSVQFHTR